MRRDKLARVAEREHARARQLSEKDRRHLSVRIVDVLGDAENGVAEAIVIAVDEDQHMMFAGRHPGESSQARATLRSSRRTFVVTKSVPGFPGSVLAIGPRRPCVRSRRDRNDDICKS
jgi:hypothetical protein